MERTLSVHDLAKVGLRSSVTTLLGQRQLVASWRSASVAKIVVSLRVLQSTKMGHVG